MSKKLNYMGLKPLDVYRLLLSGKLKKFPNNYLDKECIKEIVRYVILEKYKFTREDVVSKLDHKFFIDNLLGGMRNFFSKSDTHLLIYCFPEWNLKAWEFKNVPPGFWKDLNNQKEYVIWLAEKIGVDPYSKEGLRKITAQIVMNNGGSKVLVYSNGVYELLDTVSPGKYKKWEITRLVSWTREDAIIATRWLIEEKLQYDLQAACKIKVSDFANNHLDGMLQKVYNHSVFEALEAAYPGVFIRKKARGISLKTK